MLRPTRHRLVVAMGVATGIVALVLFVLGAVVSFGPGPGEADAVRDRVLSVFLRQQKAGPTPEPEAVDQPIPPASEDIESVTETVPVPDEAPHPVPSEPRVVASAPVDWEAEIAAAVVALESESRDREKVRQSMWRQTHSVMFESADDFVANDEQLVIANLRFKPEIHVAGLGVKIGSCFIGVPLVGVPVEKRTVGIRLFVCAEES